MLVLFLVVSKSFPVIVPPRPPSADPTPYLEHAQIISPLFYSSAGKCPSEQVDIASLPTMGKKVNWSWTSALVGAASATAAAAIIMGRPRDPTFHLVSINLTSLKLNLPFVDTEFILTVHVTNPNIAPIRYSTTEMSILYAGSHLGSAQIDAGSQPSRSCRILHLPARLSGLELAHQAGRFVADVRKREMMLDAVVDIEGDAKVMWWNHKFKVHVDSHVVVDPVFLDVIDQENKSEMQLFVA